MIDSGDISGFVLALTEPDVYAASFPDWAFADANSDGVVNGADIPAFIALVVGL